MIPTAHVTTSLCGSLEIPRPKFNSYYLPEICSPTRFVNSCRCSGKRKTWVHTSLPLLLTSTNDAAENPAGFTFKIYQYSYYLGPFSHPSDEESTIILLESTTAVSSPKSLRPSSSLRNSLFSPLMAFEIFFQTLTQIVFSFSSQPSVAPNDSELKPGFSGCHGSRAFSSFSLLPADTGRPPDFRMLATPAHLPGSEHAAPTICNALPSSPHRPSALRTPPRTPRCQGP